MVDQLIFGGFLVANLAIGLYYGRNVKTLREYALGSHSFSTLMIAATIAATSASGSIVPMYLKGIFNDGLVWIINVSGSVIKFLIIGQLILRMGEFKGSLSIAEVLGKLYGPYVRMVCSLVGIIACLLYIGLQFRVGADILGSIFTTSGYWPLFLVAITITSYSVFGGIKSVIATDFFQFVLISIFIPLLIFIVYTNLKTDVSISSSLAKVDHLSFSKLLKDKESLLWCSSRLTRLLLFSFLPHIFQRVLLEPNAIKARKSFFLASLLWLFVFAGIVVLGLLLIVDNPDIKELKNFWPFFMDKYMGGQGMKGIVAVGIITMMMSTADSYINTASVLFTNDILKPMRIMLHFKKAIRGFGVMLIFITTCLALLPISLNRVTELACMFYMPIVLAPLLLAIMGFRTSDRVVLGGMFIGEVVGIALFFYVKNISPAIPGVVTNGTFMLIVHHLLGEPGGWVGIKKRAPLIAERQANARRWRNFKTKVSRFNLFNYLNKQLPKNEITYSLLGIYVMGPVFLGFFGLEHILSQDHNVFYWTACPMLLLNALLATYPIWFKSWKSNRFITYFYPLTVGFNLFVVPAVLWIVSGYHKLYLLLLTVNFLLMLLQGALPFTGCMALFGLIGAHTLLKLIGLPALHLAVNTSSFMMIAYAGLLFLCYLIALLRRNTAQNRIASYYYELVHEHNIIEKKLRKLRTTPERFVQQLRDKITGLETAVDMSKALGETSRKLKDKQDAKASTQASDQLTRHIQDSSRYLNKLFALVEQGALLRNTNIELVAFTHKLLNAVARDPELHTPLITANQSKAKTVNWDSEKIQNLLRKGHKRLQKAHPDQDYFFLHIQDTQLAYPNYPEGLPAVAFTLTIEETAPQVESAYLPPDKVLTIATTPYQRQAQQDVFTHYGFFGAQQAPQSYLFVLPKSLKAIRPGSISDTPAQAFKPAMLRKAKGMEAAFWTVISKEEYDIPVIEKAVAFMKDAHGHQQRKSGEPYYTHPLTVAQYVSQHNDKQDVLIAALLHDTIEDTDVTPEALKLHFSPRVSELVQHLSHIENTFKKYKLSDNQTHSKLENAIHDKEAVLIKLCDRLHNLYTLGAMPKHKQIAKAKETLKVYIPMGKKVGYTQLAQELTRLCEAVLG